MLSRISILALLSLASSVAAFPQPTPVVGRDVGEDTVSVPGNAISVADYWKTAMPEVTEAPSADAAAAAQRFTIKVTNKLGRAIQTKHALNKGFADIVSGDKGQGVMQNGAQSQFVVPVGWAGNLAVVENGGGRTFLGDESLIEGSFVKQGSSPKFDIDVSYVTGFSLPITCTCDGKTVTGCNKYLWSLSKCPNDNGKGSCKNPHRDIKGSATPFFKPCQHAAYTYPDDDGANANGLCKGNTITCCVGTSCPKNPKQS